MDKSTLLSTGNWGEKISWEFHASSELPPVELCTAVFCVAIAPEDKVVLMRAKRGWGMLGGHIEEGETIHDTLVREAAEEGGFVPTQPRVLGFKKIISSEPVSHPNPLRAYPFPISYIVYFWSTTDQPIGGHSGEEVLESGVFTMEEVSALAIPDFHVIELGYGQAFLT